MLQTKMKQTSKKPSIIVRLRLRESWKELFPSVFANVDFDCGNDLHRSPKRSVSSKVVPDTWRPAIPLTPYLPQQTSSSGHGESRDDIRPDTTTHEIPVVPTKVVPRYAVDSLTSDTTRGDSYIYIPKPIVESIREYVTFRRSYKLPKRSSNVARDDGRKEEMGEDTASAVNPSSTCDSHTRSHVTSRIPHLNNDKTGEDQGVAVAVEAARFENETHVSAPRLDETVNNPVPHAIPDTSSLDCDDTLTIDAGDDNDLFGEDAVAAQPEPCVNLSQSTSSNTTENRYTKKRRLDDHYHSGLTRSREERSKVSNAAQNRRVLGPTLETPGSTNTGTVRNSYVDPLYRRRVLKSLEEPLSNRLLFVNAVVKNRVLFKFAAATSNIFCEGSGIPFDLKTKKSVPRYGCDPLSSSYVNPNDVARFAIRNTDCLPIIVCCDYEQVEMLLDECCRRKPLLHEQLAHTDGQHICCLCFPSEYRSAAYVTKSTSPRLFCEFHARNETRQDLLLYLPVVVSINANNRRIRLSMVECTFALNDTTGHEPVRTERSVPIAYRNLKRYTPTQRRGAGDVAMLLRIAQDNGLQPISSRIIEPVDVVKLLQRLCVMFRAPPVQSPAMSRPSRRWEEPGKCIPRRRPCSTIVPVRRYRT